MELRRVPVPEPGPGEILVRIGAATTCGTDVKVLRRGGHPRMLQPPTPFGHEMAGTVEAVGPATLSRSMRSLGFDGQLAMVGVIAGDEPVDPSLFAGRLFTLRRVAVGSRDGLEALAAFVAEHGIRPVIDTVFPFDSAVAAYEYFAGRRHTGKVVISVGG